MIELVSVGVEGRERLDVIAFARGARIEGAGFGEEFGAALKIGFGGAFPELVIEAHGLSPIDHGAGGVLLCDFLKLVGGSFVFEGVEESDAAFELSLGGGSAGDGEGDSAEFFGGVVVVRGVLREGWGREREDGGCK